MIQWTRRDYKLEFIFNVGMIIEIRGLLEYGHLLEFIRINMASVVN